MDIAREALLADQRIRPHVRETPLEFSPLLSSDTHRVYLKLENFQQTGSFKLRGATSKLLSLSPEETANGVVAASSGNHGSALAWAAAQLGLAAVIYVPEDASPAKIEAIRGHGAEVRVEGEDCVISEALARRFAEESGGVYVSPYNDPLVVAGQATLGVELGRQLDAIASVFLALGGGGLSSGVASYLKSIHPKVEMVACSAQRTAVMHHSVAAGEILDLPSYPTLSDGTAGGVEAGSITFDLCQRLLDRYVLVEEDEIVSAMRLLIGQHHMLVEGAAGVAVAGFLKEKERLSPGNVVIVICGANIGLEKLGEVLQAS
jgi:threonine dehydratase